MGMLSNHAFSSGITTQVQAGETLPAPQDLGFWGEDQLAPGGNANRASQAAALCSREEARLEAWSNRPSVQKAGK